MMQTRHHLQTLKMLSGMNHFIYCCRLAKLAGWCMKNLGDYLKKAQLLGIVCLSNVAEKF